MIVNRSLHQLNWAVFSMKKVITGVTAKFHQGIMLIPNSYSHECLWMKTKKVPDLSFLRQTHSKNKLKSLEMIEIDLVCCERVFFAAPVFWTAAWVTMHLCSGSVLMWNQWLDPNQSWLFSRSWCSTAGFCRGSVIPTDVLSVCSDKWVFTAPLAPNYHSYFSVATQECIATPVSGSKMFLLSKRNDYKTVSSLGVGKKVIHVHIAIFLIGPLKKNTFLIPGIDIF